MNKKGTINIHNEQEETVMKGFVNIILFSTMLITGLIFAREKAIINKDMGISYDGKEYIIPSSDYSGSSAESREEIILWEENFENGENGWSLDAGWEITSSSYHSESHSALSADSDANMDATHNILSPTLDLPAIGDGETMNFGFWLLIVSRRTVVDIPAVLKLKGNV